MAPARYDASAPPTRDSVTDSDGNPTVGSNKFQFMIFLDVAEQRIKTCNKEFWELASLDESFRFLYARFSYFPN